LCSPKKKSFERLALYFWYDCCDGSNPTPSPHCRQVPRRYANALPPSE
jgi:hypothetical protein